jgi:DNA-binding MarR family transcriptional regulator
MLNNPMPLPMGERMGYLLKRAQHALRTQMDQALASLGLTTPQYSVLSAVELSPGISNATLARAAFVTPQTMQGIVFDLEKLRLLRRREDPHHGRILQSELTKRGRVVLADAHKRVAAVETQMTARFSEKEIVALAVMLARCADGLTKPR